ncbi:MAG: hypothetical protein SVY15_09095 [Halobacteriota archaeon]|nr:hypothetical protein [Halobacteriota archaeon]
MAHRAIDGIYFDTELGDIVIGLDDSEKAKVAIEDFEKEIDEIKDVLKKIQIPL